MIADYLRCELTRDEDDMREHIREELRYAPILAHDGTTEANPVALEEAVTAKLYDISEMEIDAEPGVGFDYGHMFAMSELQHFLTLLETDPAEALRILTLKQEVNPLE
jgi:hypothetical protein